MIQWLAPCVFDLWDWVEDNCPDSRIGSVRYDPVTGNSVMHIEFASVEDETLFRLRWTAHGSGEVS